MEGDTLYNISALKGKFIVRTSDKIASFMRPVGKGKIEPSKIVTSKIKIEGTQYMIVIPLHYDSVAIIPSKTEEFLLLED